MESRKMSTVRLNKGAPFVIKKLFGAPQNDSNGKNVLDNTIHRIGTVVHEHKKKNRKTGKFACRLKKQWPYTYIESFLE